jgi:hypothetical protein
VPKSPDRLLIGNKYLVPDADGTLIEGTLEDASVLENERLMYGGYLLSDGQRVTASTPLTDAQIDEYRRDPEHFFGVFKPVTTQISDPREWYDFFLSSHKDTPREQLLNLLAAAPDIEQLKKLSQPELARTYAERLAIAKGAPPKGRH